VNSIFVYYKDSVVTVLAVRSKWDAVFTPHHLRVKAPVIRTPYTSTASFLCKFPANFGDLSIKPVHCSLNTVVFHRKVQAKVSKHIIIWKQIGTSGFASVTNFTTWKKRQLVQTTIRYATYLFVITVIRGDDQVRQRIWHSVPVTRTKALYSTVSEKLTALQTR
jgi:hypothetical protein